MRFEQVEKGEVNSHRTTVWAKTQSWDWWDEQSSGGDWPPQKKKVCFIHCQEISLENLGIDRLQRTLRGCWAEQMPFNSVVVFLGHQAPLLSSPSSPRIPSDREPRDPSLFMSALLYASVPEGSCKTPFLVLTCPSSSIKVVFLLRRWAGRPSEPLVFKNQSEHSMKSVLLPLHSWMRCYVLAGTFPPVIQSAFFFLNCEKFASI